jgi:hypothetical protein
MKFALIGLGGFDTGTSIYRTSNINRQQSSPANPGQEI